MPTWPAIHQTTARPWLEGVRAMSLAALMGVGMASVAIAEPPRGETADGESAPVSFDSVVEMARERAQARYRETSVDLPQALAELNYDDYRAIRYRNRRALWAGAGRYSAQFFHPGFLFREPVRINVIEGGDASPLLFDGELFEYGERVSALPERLGDFDAGFAGFRLLYPLNEAGRDDEIASFLGASYFRLLGPGQVYGLSARGLAVDTASPGGEEFPAFREFWLVRSPEDSSALTLYALLDSPSVAGAYRFELEAGDRTQVTVDARLFARRDVNKTGIAPLTSMFHYDGTTRHALDDYRPRVHDSDGLLMATAGGEWIWRPLTNPRALRVSALLDNGPRGFGLVQRAREFAEHLDLEARYDLRPSVWVEPLDDWGRGHVELVEIPTDSETNDNIVAYWVSAEPLRAGEERTFRYRLTVFDDHLQRQTVARAVRTRIGHAAIPGEPSPPPRRVRRFFVDFVGDALDGLEEDVTPEVVLNASRGEVDQTVVQRLPDGAGWRVSFRLTPEGDRASDLRLHLIHDDERLTETWTRVWYPDDIGN